MFSKSLTQHFKGFRSGFTDLHAKLDADTLLDFDILRSQKETQS
jgi:cellulose synthase/poly-beta-1,6-N-acetylglucosamine synthase-like glycosyltransferase